MPLPGMRDRFPQGTRTSPRFPPASPGGRTLRSFRLCSRFPCCIMFSEFCVAVIGSASMGSLFHLIHFHVSALLRREYRCDSSSGCQNCSGFPSFFAHRFWFPFLFISFLHSVLCSFHNYIAAFDSNPFHGLCQAFHSNILNAKVFSALPAFYLLLFSDFHSKSTPPAVSIGAANRVLKRGG